MRRVIIFAIVLLSGCATAGQSMVGAKDADLVAARGLPQNTMKLGDDTTVWQYQVCRSALVPVGGVAGREKCRKDLYTFRDRVVVSEALGRR